MDHLHDMAALMNEPDGVLLDQIARLKLENAALREKIEQLEAARLRALRSRWSGVLGRLAQA